MSTEKNSDKRPYAVEDYVDEHRIAAEVAQMIYDARTSAGLTQSELAQLVGTTQSVIARLEDSEYGRHSLSMLMRIARALGRQLSISMETHPAA